MTRHIPPLHSTRTTATLAQRALYLNYLFSVSNPAQIDTHEPITVYAGLLLRGTRTYTGKPAWRLVRSWRGAPFGPIRELARSAA